MTEEIKVKPCPFCGEVIKIKFITDVDPGQRDTEFLVCYNKFCLMEGPVASNKIEAVNKWNKRNG